MNLSRVVELGNTILPEFMAERHYMIKLSNRKLPEHLQRWQNTIDVMLDQVKGEGDIFVTIDQKLIKAGNSHRVGGVHVDGYWQEGLMGHRNTPAPGHKHKKLGFHTGHTISSEEIESLFMLSNVSGCKVYEGEWEGEPNEKGGCEHIDLSGLSEKILLPNTIYAGDTGTMLHEGTKFDVDTYRTLVRLNVKGWLPN